MKNTDVAAISEISSAFAFQVHNYVKLQAKSDMDCWALAMYHVLFVKSVLEMYKWERKFNFQRLLPNLVLLKSRLPSSLA